MGKPGVVSVARAGGHNFSKAVTKSIMLLEGLGVEGDAHCGATVKHASRLRIDPTLPNLRQVHLLNRELLDDLGAAGYMVKPGDMGENILTQNIDLLALPKGAFLTVGEAVVEVTGLRNPCQQIEDFQPGLLSHVLIRGGRGDLRRLTGIMGVVRSGGTVSAGRSIEITLPDEPHKPLEVV